MNCESLDIKNPANFGIDSKTKKLTNHFDNFTNELKSMINFVSENSKASWVLTVDRVFKDIEVLFMKNGNFNKDLVFNALEKGKEPKEFSQNYVKLGSG
jgi:hypothetical protein